MATEHESIFDGAAREALAVGGDWDFHREADGTLSLDSAVFQALGGASACWDNLRSAGVFESTRAKAIGDKLLAAIRSGELTGA